MASEVAAALSLELVGLDLQITKIVSVSNMHSGALCFSRKISARSCKGATIISESPLDSSCQNSHLISNNPRLDFIRAVIFLKERGLIADASEAGVIHESAIIHPTAIVERGAIVGAGVLIDEHAVIRNHVHLGAGTRVGAFSVLGSDGFGFERDERGTPIRFPHFGRVVLSEDVELGSHCCIDRGALGDTVVGRAVKCDNNVYIAHNVQVGALTLIMSGARLNGSSRVGEECWIGTAASIKEGVHVANNSTIGMGAVVISDVLQKSTVAGVPATQIR